jgi:hypothetical protein
MKRKKESRTPTFMISCTSFLGRLIENGPIKNFPVRGECFVIDEWDYLFLTQTANNVLKFRTEEIQCITNVI